MKPLLYTIVPEETLRSMLVTFYNCIELSIQIIDDHGQILISEGVSTRFCTRFKKHLPPTTAVKDFISPPAKGQSPWADPISLPVMQN